MVMTPQNVPSDAYNALLNRINDLSARLDAVSRQTLASASIGSGGITISGGGSLTIGPGGNINMPAGGHIKDAAGNIVFSTDAATGQRLSTPFLSLPMQARWRGGPFLTDTAAGDYSIVASAVTAETFLWTTVIPQTLHPKIQWAGVIGRITGTTSTPTYRLYINGTLVGTWSGVGYGGFATPQYDITAVPGVGFGFSNVGVSATIQADVTSTDNLAFTTNNLIMCGN